MGNEIGTYKTIEAVFEQATSLMNKGYSCFTSESIDAGLNFFNRANSLIELINMSNEHLSFDDALALKFYKGIVYNANASDTKNKTIGLLEDTFFNTTENIAKDLNKNYKSFLYNINTAINMFLEVNGDANDLIMLYNSKEQKSFSKKSVSKVLSFYYLSSFWLANSFITRFNGQVIFQEENNNDLERALNLFEDVYNNPYVDNGTYLLTVESLSGLYNYFGLFEESFSILNKSILSISKKDPVWTILFDRLWNDLPRDIGLWEGKKIFCN